MAFDLGTIFAEIGISTQKLDQGLMAAQTKLATTDKSISSMGQKLTASSTKMMVAGGLMAGAVLAVGAASIKMASEFETSMRNVNSISKLSETEFKALGESVIGLSKKFPQTAKELADGLYDISSSGFAGAKGMKVLEAAAMAASAGMTDTATSAKGITAVLNAFGFEADQAGRVADTMFKTVDKGVITFEELSSNIGEVVGTANIAGVGFEELSGMIAYMTTKGISAAETMTALNRMMLAVVSPTEEMAAVLKEAGYESGQAAIAQLGLSGVMDLVAKAANGDVAAIQAISGDMRAFKAVASLTGSGIEELTKFMDGFGSATDTAGSAAIALAEQSKSLSFQLDILKNNGTALGIEIGNKLIPPIANAVKGLNNLDDSTKNTILKVAELSLGVIGTGGALLLLAGIIGKVRVATQLLSTAFMANPILAVAGAAVAALGIYAAGMYIAIETQRAENQVIEDNIKLKKEQAIVIGNNTVIQQGVINDIMKEKNLSQEAARQYAIDHDLISAATQITEEATKDLTTATVESRIANQDNETTLQMLMTRYSLTKEEAQKYAEEQGLVKTATEESTGANNEEVKSIDDMRGAYSELIGVLFDSINTSNAFQEAGWALKDAQDAVTAAVKQYGEGSREAETAINGLDAASQTYIDTAYAAYTAIDNTKEVQDAAKQSAIEYGLQMVETGKWGEAAFMSMASKFGMSAKDIIAWADATDTKLEYATRMRIINLDTDGAMRSAAEFAQMVASIKDKDITITTYYRTIGNAMEAASNAAAKRTSMGGIVGYANGGTVGIPTAASGMVIPQTGRPVPVIAHEYEDILNTSQQKNIAEWIMGKANSRPDGKTTSNEVILHTIVNLDGQVLWENNEKFDLRKLGERV